ncbi:MAG TPA: hypothetical protein PKC25_11620 [Candidatus Rifleibacterium sp.]|nr:hypothetical protein [Candidatus Rifleibacterium sp.]
MKKTVTLLGDYFFYCFTLFSLITVAGIAFTPAKSFLYDEFIKSLDPKGQKRAVEVFEQKLANAGLSRETFNPMLLIRKRSRELLVLSDDILVATGHHRYQAQWQRPENS